MTTIQNITNNILSYITSTVKISILTPMSIQSYISVCGHDTIIQTNTKNITKYYIKITEKTDTTKKSTLEKIYHIQKILPQLNLQISNITTEQLSIFNKYQYIIPIQIEINTKDIPEILTILKLYQIYVIKE